MKSEIVTCHQCAVGLQNNDWTHLDCHYDQEESDRMYSLVCSNMESYGWLTHVRKQDQGGYWNCDMCHEIDIGTGHIFEYEKKA